MKSPKELNDVKKSGHTTIKEWIVKHLQIAELANEVKEEIDNLVINFHVCQNYIVTLNDTQKQLLLLDQINHAPSATGCYIAQFGKV